MDLMELDELERVCSNDLGYSSATESSCEPLDHETENAVSWKSDSCANFIDGPTDAVNISASTVNRLAGKDFEVEFQTEKESLNESPTDTDILNDKNRRFELDSYEAGLWAPYPEYYLVTEENDESVFQQLKDTMILITDVDQKDRYVYKRMVRGGSGMPVGQKQIAIVHYAAYVEYADEPVDVAYSRAMKRSLKIQMDRGNALPGFEMAVKSMTPGEHAIFIVSSTLAYGKIGCPPRYPGGAEIFYFIELLIVAPNDPLELAMQLPAEEREHLTFSAVKGLIEKCSARVNFFFKQTEFRRSLSYQKWTIDLLEHCRTADEREDQVRLKHLLSAHTNGAVIAHKIGLSKAVMYHTGNVLKMDKNNRKALYMRITALIALKDRTESLALCRRALVVHSGSEQFAKLLSRINEEINIERKKEREMYARMFQGIGSRSSDLNQKSGDKLVHKPASVPSVSASSQLAAHTNSESLTVPPVISMNKFEKMMSDFKLKSDSDEMTVNVATFTIPELVMLDRAAQAFDINMESLKDMNVRLWKS